MTEDVNPNKVVIPSFLFIGTTGSGKSTYSDYLKYMLEKTFGITVYRPSFSDKISEIAQDLFGMKEYDRTLLQDIGNKMRELDPAVWAKHIIKDLKKYNKLPVVCDGLRKPEELDVFKNELGNFIVIRLDADEKQLVEHYKLKFGKYPSKAQMTNAAEREVSDLESDMSLFNNYDKVQLERQINAVVTALKENKLNELIDRCKPGIVYRHPWNEEFVRYGKFSNNISVGNWRKIEQIISETTKVDK